MEEVLLARWLCLSGIPCAAVEWLFPPWGATITLWPQGSGPASVGPVACTWDADGLAAVGILGALLHLVSAGWRLCCALEVRGGTQTLYPVTGWEVAGTAEPPLGGNGL